MTYTAGELYEQIRCRLGLNISDRTIREWRRKAFIEQKRLYSKADVEQICRFAILIRRTKSHKLAQQFLIEEMNNDHAQRAVDVPVESFP
jgi:hypothetical protein